MNHEVLCQDRGVNADSPDDIVKSRKANLNSDLPAHEKFDRLLEDPDGIYVNPNTVDFTSSPVVAMRLVTKRATLAVQKTGQIVAGVPEMLSKATNAALINAAKLNAQSAQRLISATNCTFFSADIIERTNRRGIVVEMESTEQAMTQMLDRYEVLSSLQLQRNNDFAGLSDFMRYRMDELRGILDEREKRVTERESSVLQAKQKLEGDIAKFRKEKEYFVKRSPWARRWSIFVLAQISDNVLSCGFPNSKGVNRGVNVKMNFLEFQRIPKNLETSKCLILNYFIVLRRSLAIC